MSRTRGWTTVTGQRKRTGTGRTFLQPDHQNNCWQCSFLQITHMLKLILQLFCFDLYLVTTLRLCSGQTWLEMPDLLSNHLGFVIIITAGLLEVVQRFHVYKWCNTVNCGHCLGSTLACNSSATLSAPDMKVGS